MNQVSRFRLLKLLLVFVLLAVACEPAPPRHPGGTLREDPNAFARWLLGADGSGWSAALDDVLAGETKLEIADAGQGASGVAAPVNSKLMAVREPMLKELLSYAKAADKSEKEKHAQSLRELFRSIPTEAALPFVAMLETKDALAVTFRKVLTDDPLKDELIGILDKEPAPPPAQPQASATAPPSPGQAWARTPSSSVTLPFVNLTDEGAFDQLHKDISARMDVLAGAVNDLSGPVTAVPKGKFQRDTVPALREVLRLAKKGSDKAFKEPDASEKAKGLKDAGADYLGAFYATQMSLLALNFVIVAPHANAAKQDSFQVDWPFFAYVSDQDMLPLLQASLEGDAGKMIAALPKGTARFQHHLQHLDKWIASVNQGVILSKKVIQVMDIAMIAVSIYQVAKIPVVAGGGAPSPPMITGILPGGVAISSGVNLTSLANSLEAIRKLVAIGALDGALVSGLAGLGGLPSASFPALQKPSLSVQNPSQGGGSGGAGPQPGQTPEASGKGTSDAAKPDAARSDTAKPEVGRVTGDELKALRQEFENVVKPRYWKNEAATNGAKYSAENLALMKKGKPPIGPDGYPMELHHKKPLTNGGTNDLSNIEPKTRTDHRLDGNYKKNHPGIP